MPGPPLYLYRPLPFHTVGADSISARAPSPLRPTNPRVALLYSLYVRAVRGISRALKTARRAVFAPRYADAGPGLFDSRTPLLLNMYNKKKKAQPLAKLSFLVTRTGIELLSFYKYPLMQYVLTIILSLVWISLKGIFISVWYKVWYSSYKKCGTAPACKNK